MRYLLLAGLMFASGLLVVSLNAPERTYMPLVRLRTSDGYFITAVQDRTQDRRKCDEANERFLGPIRRGCPTCVVESVECSGHLHGFEKALASAPRCRCTRSPRAESGWPWSARLGTRSPVARRSRCK